MNPDRENHAVGGIPMNDRGESAKGRVTVEVELANQGDLFRLEDGTITPDKVRRVKMPGVVDTGATYLVIPKDTAKQLGLPNAGKVKVRYADRRSATRQMVNLVAVELLGRKGNFKAIVEPNRDTVLIGAIVLEDLNLLVDCSSQTPVPRDPTGVITEIE
jgi:predicted aspartyl protease